MAEMKETARADAPQTSTAYPDPSPSSLQLTHSEARSLSIPNAQHYSQTVDEGSSCECSTRPASVLPSATIRGTEELMTSFFTGEQLGEIQDPELLCDLPVLLPPPQTFDADRSDEYRPRPFWGVHPVPRIFFGDNQLLQQRQTPVPVNPDTQIRLARYHELKHTGVHFNETLMQNRAFNNPNVLSQLVDFLGIDETRSNLPCVDTGRIDGSWRAKFPFNDAELVEGDPVATENRQKKEAVAVRRSRQLHKDADRKIDFSRGRYDDDSQRPSKRRSSGSTSNSRRA